MSKKTARERDLEKRIRVYDDFVQEVSEVLDRLNTNLDNLEHDDYEEFED